MSTEKYTPTQKEFLAALGHTIQEIRRSKAITQQNLSALCDLEKANISRIENGKTNVTADTLRKIAAVLQVPVSAFFPITEQP